MNLRARLAGVIGVRAMTPPRDDRRLVRRAASREAELSAVPDGELAERMSSAAIQVSADVLALLREMGRRALGERAHDCQLLAVLGLTRGRIVQLDTGEGKTLTGALASVLYAIQGLHVTVVASNDYLARRDASWMAPLYELADVTVRWVEAPSTAAERRAAYAADVTYVPASELGFDALRDRLVGDVTERVSARRDVAIVDEADSILIDQARLPLVLAGAVDEAQADVAMAELIAAMESGTHYAASEDGYNVSFTEAGEQLIEQAFGAHLYAESDEGRTLTRANLALYAQTLLARDIDYIVRDGEVQLVDASKGRVALLQRWPDGLQTAVEAKEGLATTQAGEILDSITTSELMSEFSVLAGMTGTAVAAADQFATIYGLNVEVIEPNVPCVRVDEPLQLYRTREAKLAAIVARITEERATGRPILVGTPSVAESEELAALLGAERIPHVVLNAKNDQVEAEIIAEAGQRGAVTVSTQMAGRGVDIKLGGTPGNSDEIAVLGGLLVIGTGLNISSRIDDQLRGRAGRQGDPGGSVFFASLDDEMISRHARGIRTKPDTAGRISSAGALHQVTHAQRVADGAALQIYTSTYQYSVLQRRQRRLVLDRREQILALPEPERSVRLHFLDREWADYLAYLAHLRESVPLRTLSGKSPVLQFNADAAATFKEVVRAAEDNARDVLANNTDLGDAMDLGFGKPSATWTYVVQDNPFGSPFERFIAGVGRKLFGINDRP